MVETLEAWPWLGVSIFFVLGAIFGSFGNVVVLRLPKGESVVTPGSRCGNCGASIRWYHNVPIFAWFLLRGRCANCKEPFSIRYAVVEALMAILFALLYYKIGFSWLLLEYLLFVFAVVVASVIDLDHMILPDVLTLSGIVIGLLGALINPDRQFLPAVLGVLMGGGFLWAIAYIYYALRKVDGMGGGDIKLLAWIGAVLGWKAIPFVILVSSLVGSLAGILIAVIQKKDLKTTIPFGPYLALAAILYIFGGHEIGEWYLGLFFVNY